MTLENKVTISILYAFWLIVSTIDYIFIKYLMDNIVDYILAIIFSFSIVYAFIILIAEIETDNYKFNLYLMSKDVR
jgi:hypothetical protein